MTRWRLSDRVLEFPPPLAAGIVNVTDDSFFEGARSGTPERAIEDGIALVEAGFDLLDVGAVPARAGDPVAPDDEAARLVPTLEGLAQRVDVPVSADTFQAEVAARALDAGAVAINDISGGAEPEILELVGQRGCGYVLMHIEGPPRSNREPVTHDDPVAYLIGWFAERLESALARGVHEDQIALDPGFDFDLSVRDNTRILAGLGELRRLGRPLFVALSRKDFLGALLAGSWEERDPAVEREWATAAATALAVAAGAEVLRLHDRSALDALRVAAAIADPSAADGGAGKPVDPAVGRAHRG
ncbi:MAG TPA: dihydropteroate synthase [Solirubrobacterales bacterium]|jgi:dihydropteroate synthase|nr:dihydropteroate synthase [Solirubrobacterales bacterium]